MGLRFLGNSKVNSHMGIEAGFLFLFFSLSLSLKKVIDGKLKKENWEGNTEASIFACSWFHLWLNSFIPNRHHFNY